MYTLYKYQPSYYIYYCKMSELPSRTLASLCPIYMLSSSGPFIDKKLYLHSVATALANNVFPVPGGPYNKIPRYGIKIAIIISFFHMAIV